jgi:hypothetical protein
MPVRRPPDYLEKENPHVRDERISFDEGPHIYTIDGDDSFTSVTTWNHQHFKPFDADEVISKMMASDRWPQSKYFGQSREEIKEGWETNRDEAARAGTKMHYDVECYYNRCLEEGFAWELSREGEYFLAFLRDWGHLRPYRTEWTVFHEELKLAGSIDMVFENTDGTLQIYDWKRSRGIRKTSFGGESATTPCIEHLPDSNYWHYCLQLNIYKYILESKYEKTVTDMYLVCMHPNNGNGSYQRIRVSDLSEEVGSLVAHRQQQLQDT